MFLRSKKNHHRTARSVHSEKEFEELYTMYSRAMISMAHNRTGDREAAKEIVQDVFLSLWERREGLRVHGSIKHYLFRAVKLEIIDHYRKKNSREKHQHYLVENAGRWSRSTEERVLFNELSGSISALVEKLPSQCREVYRLSREKGLNNKEIALSLTVTEKTVESHLTKALKFLRSRIDTSSR